MESKLILTPDEARAVDERPSAAAPVPYSPSVLNHTEPPPVRVCVLLPTHEKMEAGFAFDLQRMMVRLGATVVADGIMDIRTFMIQGTLVHTARCDLVRDALEKTNCTHMLFLDTDMRFPWQLPLRLLAHNKDIVAVNYSTRKGAPKPITFLDLSVKKGTGRFLQPPADPSTLTKENALVKVQAVGMGAALIRREVFEALSYPWFETVYDHVNRKWVGEDVDFCLKAEKAGYEVWVDQLLSEEIGHIGNFEYTMDHVRAANEAREEIEKQKAEPSAATEE